MYGISIEDRAQPTLEANTCQENRTGGIAYYGSSSGTARQNTCNGNGFGIEVDDQAQPTLEANSCQGNGFIGISYAGSSSGMARKNVCSANGQSGIQMESQAQPTLEANTCQENDSGIFYSGSAAGTARKNVCSANEYQGILVSDQAQPTLEANTCQENQHRGIMYVGSAAGIVWQNTCNGNDGVGIFVGDQAQPTLEANTCQENQQAGIAYLDSAAGIAQQNVCSGNEDNIYVEPTAQPILKDNQLYLSSDQSERVLYDFPLEGGAMLYTGSRTTLGGCHCTITDRRLILQCGIGGTQQILFQDITGLSPVNGLIKGHYVRLELGPFATLDLGCKNKQGTYELASRIEEAMMS